MGLPFLQKSIRLQKVLIIVTNSEAKIATFCHSQPKTLALATLISGWVWVGLIYEYCQGWYNTADERTS